VSQEVTKSEPQWANPGALGLVAFGFSTMLLQIFNLGLITNAVPLVFGFFWGGLAQVIVGIIDGKRGDTFGLTAFTSYGLFWMSLSMYFFLTWTGVLTADKAGLGWMCIMFAIFTGLMFIGTLKMTKTHMFIFASLTVLFLLLAGHFLWGWSGKIAGVEGMFCGASAAYGGIAVALNAKFGKTVCPMGICK
jgi:succinate-acetate transporter protein